MKKTILKNDEWHLYSYVDTGYKDDYSVESVWLRKYDGTIVLVSCDIVPKKKEDNLKDKDMTKD